MMALNKNGRNGHRDSVPVAATAAHVEAEGADAVRACTHPTFAADPRNNIIYRPIAACHF